MTRQYRDWTAPFGPIRVAAWFESFERGFGDAVFNKSDGTLYADGRGVCRFREDGTVNYSDYETGGMVTTTLARVTNTISTNFKTPQVIAQPGPQFILPNETVTQVARFKQVKFGRRSHPDFGLGDLNVCSIPTFEGATNYVITTGCGSVTFNYDPNEGCGTVDPEVRLPVNMACAYGDFFDNVDVVLTARAFNGTTQQFDILAYATNLTTEPVVDSGEGDYTVTESQFGAWHTSVTGHTLTNSGGNGVQPRDRNVFLASATNGVPYQERPPEDQATNALFAALSSPDTRFNALLAMASSAVGTEPATSRRMISISQQVLAANSTSSNLNQFLGAVTQVGVDVATQFRPVIEWQVSSSMSTASGFAVMAFPSSCQGVRGEWRFIFPGTATAGQTQNLQAPQLPPNGAFESYDCQRPPDVGLSLPVMGFCEVTPGAVETVRLDLQNNCNIDFEVDRRYLNPANENTPEGSNPQPLLGEVTDFSALALNPVPAIGTSTRTTYNFLAGGCGDGRIMSNASFSNLPTEQCDQQDLDGRDCTNFLDPQGTPWTGGTLFCNNLPNKPFTPDDQRNDCTFNTQLCARCGNNQTDDGEFCDGTDLPLPNGGQASCSDFDDSTGNPFDEGQGTLSCWANNQTAGCTGPNCFPTDPAGIRACRFNLSLCQRCGNGDQENTEACDMNDFGGRHCTTQLGPEWTNPDPDGSGGNAPTNGLTCTSGCTIQTTNCLPFCGDPDGQGPLARHLDPPEQCDGSIGLSGVTCNQVKGESGWQGPISCNAQNQTGDPNVAPACRFNDNACTAICVDQLVRGGETCDVGAGSGYATSATCGTDEVCGGANASNGSHRCQCVPAFCGDGLFNATIGEECDAGTGTGYTTAGCTGGQVCGQSGVVENANRCECVAAFCGDGITNGQDQCDVGHGNGFADHPVCEAFGAGYQCGQSDRQPQQGPCACVFTGQ
jgi:hypothetical protein